MRLGSAEMSRELDRVCMEEINIPGLVLMENAALKVVQNISTDSYDSFVIVCGKGNNGGDGFAIARHLFILGKKIEIFIIGNDNKLSDDCKVNYDILLKLGLKINKINNINDLQVLRNTINRCDVVIDSIFGTGLKRNIDGIYKQAISVINENSKYTISVDIPSGLDANNGNILGMAVVAQKTVSFQLYKRGFLSYGADKITGEVVIENIGIPENVIDKVCDKEYITERQMIKDTIRKRENYSHKGDFGKVLMVGGSRGFTGAAYISAQAAVRTGAGLVTLACPKEIQDILSNKLVEAMTIELDDDRINEIISNSKGIGFGPGMGNNKETFKILQKIIKNAECPIIIDADGINVLKGQISLLSESKNKIILTPHPGEMSRLTGKSIEEINDNRIEIAKEFAAANKVIIILKGYNTVITDGDTVMINPTGTSAMANGGMGDCLTGMLTAFIAQGYEPLQAAYMSVYIHGYSGDKLSKNMFCVNASHVLEEIPYVINEINIK